MKIIFALVLVHFLLSLCLVGLGVASMMNPESSSIVFVVLLVLAAFQLLMVLLLWRWRNRDETSVDKLPARLSDLESCVPDGPPEVSPTALPNTAEELTKLLAELRRDLMDAGAREQRLRDLLRSRSAALMRLASHLTRAQDIGRPPRPSAESSACLSLATDRALPAGEPVEPVPLPVEAVPITLDRPVWVSTAANVVSGEETKPQTKLLELASASPELRDALLHRLRAKGENADSSIEMDREATKASRPAEAVARKLTEQAAELQRWHEISEESSRQLQGVQQEVQELHAKLKLKEGELSQMREELAMRKVINVSAQSPDLCLKWMEDGPLPGEVASVEGMKQLRQSLATISGPAQLCVGPPPADWKVFLRLRLRQAERWEPALLQLSAGQESGASDFLGLLWPAG
mmetsp:Transcript_31850/g.68619  ORF Transcript_31850/g.68619 Transcript_31850/m.68619 type:complete len:407 (+) Transcript_31850:21-1241(+)